MAARAANRTAIIDQLPPLPMRTDRPLPPQREAEEVGRAKDAEILVGVVQAQAEPVPVPAVLEAAAEGEALEVLLVAQRRGGRRGREVVGRGVGVAAAEGEAEVRAADLLRLPLRPEREARLVV